MFVFLAESEHFVMDVMIMMPCHRGRDKIKCPMQAMIDRQLVRSSE